MLHKKGSIMNFQELKEKLRIQDGKVTVSGSLLTSNLNDFIDKHYNGQSIVITGAQAGPGDGENGTVVITGKSDFLNTADLQVTAHFSLNGQGAVRMLLEYPLRGDDPAPDDWTFSRSFPKLPAVLDYDTPVSIIEPDFEELNRNQKPFLDSLYLTNTAFIVSTDPEVDPEFGAPLQQGINFIGKFRPRGMLGILETTMGDDPELILYGTIVMPRPGRRPLPLEPMEYIWDRPEVPGIHLKADLNVDLNFGKMTFQQFVFRVYSPVSTDWQAENPTFEPVQGYAGKISIPSADIEIDVASNIKWNLPEALLYADCEGITLEKLTQLVDLSGSSGLSDLLPAPLEKGVRKLKSLELMRVSLMLSMYDYRPRVDMVSFTVGFPDLDWPVWGDHLEVTGLSCRFEIENPFGGISGSAPSRDKPSFSLMVTGTMDVEGVPLKIRADSKTDFTIYAQLEKDQAIPLQKIIKTYIPQVPPPADLTIDKLLFTVAPGRFYGISSLMAGEPHPWVIPLGRSRMLISDTAFSLTQPADGDARGYFSGVVAFSNEISFAMHYDFPGGFMIRGDFPHCKMSGLIGTLCDQKVRLPKGFDIEFESASALIKREKVNESASNYVFQCAAEVEELGSFAFEARQVDGRWGFASGVSLRKSLSDVPGLSALGIFEKAFKLQKLVLVSSSFDNPAFQFPELSRFNNPRITAKNIALPGRGGVVAGLNAFAQWRINTRDPKQKLLQKLLGLDPILDVTLQVGPDPAKEAKLFVRYDATLNGHPFLCQFGAVAQGNDVGLFLNGSITVKIQKQPQTFDLTMVFVKTGAFLSANMSGTAAVKFGAFQLSNLALEIGVNWQGVPSLGIAATLNVSRFQSSMAIFFDSKNPAQSLVAGSVSDLTLKDVLDTLVGSTKVSSLDKPLAKVSIRGTHYFHIDAELADDLDQLEFKQLAAAFHNQGGITIPSDSTRLHLAVAKKGRLWYLTDKTTMRYYQLRKRGEKIEVSIQAQFYCAPMDTYIGSKRFPQGYFINGAIRFLGFDALARVDISRNKGIAIDARMDKIVLVDENILSITAAKGKDGPRISVATYSQPKHKDKACRPPHFYVNGQTRMLGVVQKTYASLTVKGLEFNLKGPLAPAVNFDVKGVINGSKGMQAGGKVKVGLGVIDLGRLGRVPIKTDAEGFINVKVSGKTVGATAKATFRALSRKHSIAAFKLNTKSKALANLAGTMAKEAAKVLQTVFKDAQKWTDAVGQGMVEGVDDAGKVLKDVYRQTAGQAAKIMKNAGYATNDLSKTMRNVYKASSRDIARTLKGMRVGSKDIARSLKYSGASANDIGSALRHELGFGSDDGAKLAKEIGFGSKEIACMLRGPWDKGSKDTAKILRKSCKFGKSTIKSAMKHAGWSKKDVNKAIDWIKKLF